MNFLRSLFSRYRRIESHIIFMIGAHFAVQSINTAFFLLLNYFMVKENYADFEIAKVLSYRFLAVFLLAFPLGLWIKGRFLKPFFYIATIGTPLISHLIIFSIQSHWDSVLYISTMFWGMAFTCMQITVLPFILLNAKKEYHSEAISLSFLSMSAMICMVGIGNFILNKIDPNTFDEKTVLQIVATLSMIGIYFVSKIKVEEKRSNKVPFKNILKDYDWPLIIKVELGTLFIAVGAGFTIPVINLFFLNIHGVPSDTFSILGAATFFLVACVILLMPYIRRSFGYRVAITRFQTVSVIALFLLATTEYYKTWEYAVYVAIFFYVLRQPLMSAASPMASELTLYYVGKRNQELIGALNASIWSGSWFVSMTIFGWLRRMNFQYVSIFLITVALYVIGIVWYAYLIRSYKKETGNSGIEKKKGPINTQPKLAWQKEETG